MKRVWMLVLVLLLSVCMGCGSADEQMIDDMTPPETVETPADDEITAKPEEPELPPVQETEEPVAPALVVDTGLYVRLFEEGISINDYSPSYEAYKLNPCSVLANDPNDFGDEWTTPYWITRFLVHDLNGDGVPELVLQTGEVEQFMYIFTIRDGAVYCTGYGDIDNQEGTDYLTQYREEQTGRLVVISKGALGSGAGNFYFTEQILPETLVCESAGFSAMDDMNETGFFTRYYANDVEVSEDQYRAIREAFYGGLTEVDRLEFSDMTADPVTALTAVLENS